MDLGLVSYNTNAWETIKKIPRLSESPAEKRYKRIKSVILSTKLL
jgi:hypothetical protein